MLHAVCALSLSPRKGVHTRRALLGRDFVLVYVAKQQIHECPWAGESAEAL